MQACFSVCLPEMQLLSIYPLLITVKVEFSSETNMEFPVVPDWSNIAISKS